MKKLGNDRIRGDETIMNLRTGN